MGDWGTGGPGGCGGRPSPLDPPVEGDSPWEVWGCPGLAYWATLMEGRILVAPPPGREGVREVQETLRSPEAAPVGEGEAGIHS